MSNAHLATYLNDHLAGAMVALELLAHLENLPGEAEASQFAADLRIDIEADRLELLTIMGELTVAESRFREAAGWLAEKATRLKLHLDDPAAGEFLRFEILEAVAVGIEGKAALWTSLSAAAENTPRLRVRDYNLLLRRAREQREKVEARRVTLARTTFSDSQ